MATLLSSVEKYRCETEEEAETFIQEQKAINDFELKKFSHEKKQKKSKGEIVDEWYMVTLNKIFEEQ